MSTADKVRHVTAAGQTRDHECHWPGCGKQVPPAVWGCRPHWYALPKHLRDKIWRTYRIGQEKTLSPSKEYVAVAKDEFSLRHIDAHFAPAPAAAPDGADTFVASARRAESAEKSGKSGVLVVGVDSLLTQLARCCRPERGKQTRAATAANRGWDTQHRQPSVATFSCLHPASNHTPLTSPPRLGRHCRGRYAFRQIPLIR